MWFLHQAQVWIDYGYKALHMGQHQLYAEHDTDYILLHKLMNQIRDYATSKGSFVLLNGEGVEPDGQSSKLGGTDQLIFDFDGKPIFAREISPSSAGPYGCDDPLNENTFYATPCENSDYPAVLDPCVLQAGGANTGGISPLGCEYEATPYFAYFDHTCGALDPDGETLCYDCAEDDFANEGIASNYSGGYDDVYGYDDARWFFEIESECQRYWWNYYYCQIREFSGGNGFLQIPGIINVSMPENNCNVTPDPIGPGLFILADDPNFEDLATQTLTPSSPPVFFISNECIPLYCDIYCNDDVPAPDGFVYRISQQKYTITVGNTDCSSTYTIHIKRPDGTWVKSNWEHETSRIFYPQMTGIYTFYIRQDNIGIDNWGGVTQIEEDLYIERLCCDLIPSNECRDMFLIKQIDLTCIKENDNSLEYYYELTLEDEASASFVSLSTLSEDVTIINFNIMEANKMTGNFITYDKVNPHFKASVSYLSSSANESKTYPLIKQAPFCNLQTIIKIPSAMVEFDQLTQKTAGIERIGIYPNPASDEVTIIAEHYNKLNQKMEFRLLDPLGRLVKNYDSRYFVDGRLTLHIGELPSGTYFLNVKNQLFSHTKKLIKK